MSSAFTAQRVTDGRTVGHEPCGFLYQHVLPVNLVAHAELAHVALEGVDSLLS